VFKQLNQLRVQCNHCGQVGIERGNFSDHEAKCNKKKVSCSSADIQCPWTGPRYEQAQHEATCVCKKLQPIIHQLQNQLKEQSDKSDVIKKDLNHQISHLLAEVYELKKTQKEHKDQISSLSTKLQELKLPLPSRSSSSSSSSAIDFS
jgi:predicted RNase H-like nuclease (RuvC/YqgF family)